MILHPPADTGDTTGALLVPDHDFLGDTTRAWSLTGVTDELQRMLTGDGPQHLRLFLVFPRISLREIDSITLTTVLGKFSRDNKLNVELIHYIDKEASGPMSFPTPINSHLSLQRRLTVQVMAKDMFARNGNWQMTLRILGIMPKLPMRGNYDANLVTLLESGFVRPVNLSRLLVMSRGGAHNLSYVHSYPASGRQ